MIRENMWKGNCNAGKPNGFVFIGEEIDLEELVAPEETTPQFMDGGVLLRALVHKSILQSQTHNRRHSDLLINLRAFTVDHWIHKGSI